LAYGSEGVGGVGVIGDIDVFGLERFGFGFGQAGDAAAVQDHHLRVFLNDGIGGGEAQDVALDVAKVVEAGGRDERGLAGRRGVIGEQVDALGRVLKADGFDAAAGDFLAELGEAAELAGGEVGLDVVADGVEQLADFDGVGERGHAGGFVFEGDEHEALVGRAVEVAVREAVGRAVLAREAGGTGSLRARARLRAVWPLRVCVPFLSLSTSPPSSTAMLGS
jgi:hypothetical protein